MEISTLDISDFHRCKILWNIDSQKQLAERFLKDLKSGNRETYICKENDRLIAEISLVKDMNDCDYTIPDRRVYVSHLIVRKDCRRKGIGKQLLTFVTEKAKEAGYSEMTVGVDLNNLPAISLYTKCGFNQILLFDQDAQGPYFKLLKTIS